LSGGQRQRIALARALYGDPVLVVLDEPNSNLDDAGEKALTDAIKDLSSRGRTSIIITHRPSALGAANKLLVLREGVIAAYGPREEVLAALNGRPVEPAPAPPAAANSAGPPRGVSPPVLVNRQVPVAPVAPPAAPQPPLPAAPSTPTPEGASGMPPFNLKFGD
jgi:ATP-binding cassette subfamily C exporter for protease/lipase